MTISESELRKKAIKIFVGENTEISKTLMDAVDTAVDDKRAKNEHKLVFINDVYDANEIDSPWEYGRMNLFGTSLYYAQNGKTRPSGQETNTQVTDVEMAKAYLWLHTIPFNYEKIMKSPSFFRKGNQPTGGIESLPYLYLVFLGALLWRKEYHDNSNPHTDPIKFPPQYANPTQTPDRSLLFKTSNGYKLVFQSVTGDMTPVSVDSFINNSVDSHVKNVLISGFQEFVNTVWISAIKPRFELMLLEPIVDESIQTSGVLPREIYLDDFARIASTVYGYLDKKCGDLDEICFNSKGLDIDGNLFKPENTCFRLVLPYDKSNIMLFPLDGSALVEAMLSIYNRTAYVLTTGFVSSSHPVVKSVPKNFARSYISEFTETLDTLAMKAETSEVSGFPVDGKAKQLRDFHVAMYMYFKNLWDKWLNGYYYSNESIKVPGKSDPEPLKNTFTVRNYFSNFLFMDSFYRNIFNKLKLNCGTLLEHYANRTNNYNMFSYLGAVASSHQCMFLSIPDYINLGDNDGTVASKNLGDLFRPMPANAMPPMQIENRFIVMYTHQPSSVTTVEKSDFRVDSFDIWSEDDGQSVKPLKVFCHPCDVKGETEQEKNLPINQMNRYGYNVPAFGVAYSRQANSIFKSVKASMDNPVMTEQAVLAMGAIAELGNSTKKKVCFYGQDIYPIYSNYSYIIEIEMMGDAQIQPLMYFQLMNIPMFRGTYMIISVTHNMTQGDMTTKIKATKMSKYATPFVSNWFTLPPDDEGAEFGYTSRYTSELLAQDGTVMTVGDCKFANAIKSVYGVPYSMGGKDPKTALDCSGLTRYVYRNAYNQEIGDGTSQQLSTFTGMANNGTGMLSEVTINKGNVEDLKGKADCGDILFMVDKNKNQTTIAHVALYVGYINGNHYIAEASSKNGVVCRKASVSSLADDRHNFEIHYIGHWNHTPDNSGCAKVENGGGIEFEKYTGTLKTVPISNEEKMANGYKIMDSLINQGFTLNGKTVKLTPMQAAAIAGVWFQESQWNPQAVGAEGDYGVAQWLGERKYDNYKIYCKEKGITNGNDATDMKTLEEQLAYAKWEFNRHFFKSLCHLWGDDPNYKNRFGWICGNMMVYEGDMEYSDSKLHELVYRFTVGFENLNAPNHGKFFAVEERANYAKTAYDLYMNKRVTGSFLVNYTPKRRNIES